MARINQIIRNATLDDIIRLSTKESCDSVFGALNENDKELKRQETQAKKAEKAADVNKKAKTDGSKSDDETVEADKQDLVPKEMIRHFEKSDDKPNISADKMQVVFPSKEQVIRADVKNILTMLNMMRSGHSLKKTNIRRSLQDYYNTLDAGEKQALYSILSGLTQIISANVSGNDAVDPSYVDLNIKPKPKDSDEPTDAVAPTVEPNSTQSVQKPDSAPRVKPKVVQKQVSKTKPKSSDELPIVVGEVANKSSVRKIYENLNEKA